MIELKLTLKERLGNYFRDVLMIDENKMKSFLKKNILDKENSIQFNSHWPNPDRDPTEKVLSWVKISEPAKVITWYDHYKKKGIYFNKDVYNVSMDKIMRGYDELLIEFVNELPCRKISQFINIMKDHHFKISSELWDVCMNRKYYDINESVISVLPAYEKDRLSSLYHSARETHYWKYAYPTIKKHIKDKLEITDPDELNVYF